MKARGLYVRAYRGSPADLAEIRGHVDHLQRQYYLDGPPANEPVGVHVEAVVGVTGLASRWSYAASLQTGVELVVGIVDCLFPALLEIDGARVVFVRRDTQKLDLERTETELGTGWVTTVEQTLLDLAARPELGGISKTDADEAIRALATRADWATVESLAQEQRRPGALKIAQAARGA